MHDVRFEAQTKLHPEFPLPNDPVTYPRAKDPFWHTGWNIFEAKLLLVLFMVDWLGVQLPFLEGRRNPVDGRPDPVEKAQWAPHALLVLWVCFAAIISTHVLNYVLLIPGLAPYVCGSYLAFNAKNLPGGMWCKVWFAGFLGAFIYIATFRAFGPSFPDSTRLIFWIVTTILGELLMGFGVRPCLRNVDAQMVDPKAILHMCTNFVIILAYCKKVYIMTIKTGFWLLILAPILFVLEITLRTTSKHRDKFYAKLCCRNGDALFSEGGLTLESKTRMASLELLCAVYESLPLVAWLMFFYIFQVVEATTGYETIRSTQLVRNGLMSVLVEFSADTIIVRFGPKKPFDEGLANVRPTVVRHVILGIVGLIFNIVDVPIRSLYFVIGPTGCLTIYASLTDPTVMNEKFEKELACINALEER